MRSLSVRHTSKVVASVVRVAPNVGYMGRLAPPTTQVKRFDDGEENGEDYAAAVESIKPEMWIKSSGMTASTRSLRPDSSDVCSIM